MYLITYQKSTKIWSLKMSKFKDGRRQFFFFTFQKNYSVRFDCTALWSKWKLSEMSFWTTLIFMINLPGCIILPLGIAKIIQIRKIQRLQLLHCFGRNTIFSDFEISYDWFQNKMSYYIFREICLRLTKNKYIYISNSFKSIYRNFYIFNCRQKYLFSWTL